MITVKNNHTKYNLQHIHKHNNFIVPPESILYIIIVRKGRRSLHFEKRSIICSFSSLYHMHVIMLFVESIVSDNKFDSDDE